MPKVALVRCERYEDSEQAIRKVLELLKFNRKLEGTIFLKPNVCAALSPNRAATTHPLIVRAVIGARREMGAEKIILGEGEGLVAPSDLTLERSGIAAVARETGVDLVRLDKMEHVVVPIPGGKRLKEVKLPRILLECDFFVNIPKLKTNTFTLLSLGMKNLMGLLRREDRVKIHRCDLNIALADLMRVIRPDLTIMDGIIAMEGQGPVLGTPIPLNIVIGGEDVVAVDAVSASVVGVDPEEVEMIRVAWREGIGVGDLEKIEIVGESIASVRRHIKRPIMGLYGRFEGVEIYAGGACIGCLDPVGVILEELRVRNLLERIGKLSVIVGRSPYVPESVEGNVLVVGDCAQEYSHLGRFLPGCPPLISLVNWLMEILSAHRRRDHQSRR